MASNGKKLIFVHCLAIIYEILARRLLFYLTKIKTHQKEYFKMWCILRLKAVSHDHLSSGNYECPFSIEIFHWMTDKFNQQNKF